MSAKRKHIEMRLTISVPNDMKTSQARREIRSLINEQCNYTAEYGDVKVRKISSAGSIVK